MHRRFFHNRLKLMVYMDGYGGNETSLKSTMFLLILYNDEKEGSSEFIGFGKKDTSRRTTSSPSRGFTIILPIPKSGSSG
jgi:hypothetical protein